MIYSHIKETLGLKRWDSLEAMILRNLEMFSILEYVGNTSERNRGRGSQEIWDPPPYNMFKLNFNEASKGNLGLTGFRGAIHNSEGKIVGLCWGYIGENTNNVAELKRLIVGIDMAIQQGWIPIILEGDSRIILQMATKLLHGKLVSKVADNWKMDHTLEQVRGLVRAHSKVQIHHVKRKQNNLADLLANYGVRHKQEFQQQRWEDVMEESLQRNYQRVMERDEARPRCG